jgi:hypothetical protein
MAEAAGVHIVENSPEYVAFKLLQEIAAVEGRAIRGIQGDKRANRKWILDTYAQCIAVVRGQPTRVEFKALPKRSEISHPPAPIGRDIPAPKASFPVPPYNGRPHA